MTKKHKKISNKSKNPNKNHKFQIKNHAFEKKVKGEKSSIITSEVNNTIIN